MASNAAFAEIASLAGDPARATMLHALMDGRALTASELAGAAGVTAQTASGHLARLGAASLITVEKQGRHRYHRLASPAVAEMLEAIMRVASRAAPKPVRVGPREQALREARTCYDHIAGRLGVAIADALVAGGHAEIDGEAGVVTESGRALFGRLGIDLDPPAGKAKARLLCRPCLDWSERRPHLAGRLGAALCSHCLDAHWVRRVEGSRALTVTPKGERLFRETLGVRLGDG